MTFNEWCQQNSAARATAVQAVNQNLLNDLKWCMTANLCGYLTRSDAEFINEVCRKAYEEIKQLRGNN